MNLWNVSAIGIPKLDLGFCTFSNSNLDGFDNEVSCLNLWSP